MFALGTPLAGSLLHLAAFTRLAHFLVCLAKLLLLVPITFSPAFWTLAVIGWKSFVHWGRHRGDGVYSARFASGTDFQAIDSKSRDQRLLYCTVCMMNQVAIHQGNKRSSTETARATVSAVSHPVRNDHNTENEFCSWSRTEYKLTIRSTSVSIECLDAANEHERFGR